MQDGRTIESVRPGHYLPVTVRSRWLGVLENEVRRWLALLVAVCASVPLLPGLAVADDPPVPRCDQYEIPFGFTTNSPAVGDSVYFTLHACSNCVDLWSTWWSEGAQTLSLNAIYWPGRCDLLAPCVPETLLGFAGIADSVGTRWITLRVQTSVVFDSTTCISEKYLRVSYVVRDSVPSGPIPPCENPPALPIALDILPPCPQPADTVYLQATSPCSACLDLHGIAYQPGHGWVVSSTSGPLEWCDRARCPEPDAVRVPLGRFATGNHEVLVVKSNLVTNSDGSACVIQEQTPVRFFVGADCPPPPPDSLQFVDRVEIGLRPCDTCPLQVCAGLDISVALSGAFPDHCYSFRRLEILPSSATVVGPPTLRAVFAASCTDSPCGPGSTPWNVWTALPPLPVGSYALRVESAILSACAGDSTLTVTGAGLFPFAVLDSCGPPPQPGPCLWVSWGHPDGEESCDASVAPGRPAKLTLGMRATEPVAGFQGKLFLSPPGLEVIDIEPVYVAQGMRVAWNRTSDGASFVLFSETGQLLPACDPLPACPACCWPSPVLEVTVAARESLAPAPVTQMLVWELLGADSLGNSIFMCVENREMRERMTARICADRACDANRDGYTDVRDLVGMVRCLLEPATCDPDTVRDRLDCERDGDLDLADVMCCAHVLLRGTVPDSAETVPAPEVYVRFGEPARTAQGLDVPIALHGGLRLSAARLQLDLPLEHFAVAGLTVHDWPQDWLALHEIADGMVSLGLIRIARSAVIPEAPNLVRATLHLALRPGGSMTGQLWLNDGDFTGSSGEMLIPGESQRSVKLGEGGSIEAFSLAPPRPNPATREAALSLTLARAAEAELSVHDVEGRRIATLHRGRLEAGSHPFTWSGNRDGGGAAANGLYFVRARVDDLVLTRKLTLLRTR